MQIVNLNPTVGWGRAINIKKLEEEKVKEKK